MNVRTLGVLVGIVGSLCGAQPSQALVLSIQPPTQAVSVGGALSVHINVSGLGGITLGAFDIDVLFDPAILQPTGVTFGTSLGGDSAQDFDLAVSGTVNAAEVSVLPSSDLDPLQGDSLTLFSLAFTSAAPGTSSLSLVVTAISDGDGDGIAASQTSAAQVTVEGAAGVPEPATLALLGVGLVGLRFSRRQAH